MPAPLGWSTGIGLFEVKIPRVYRELTGPEAQVPLLTARDPPPSRRAGSWARAPSRTS